MAELSRRAAAALRLRHTRVPVRPLHRWLLRLVLSLPFLLLALLTYLPRRDFDSGNALLLDGASVTASGSASATWLDALYPPIPNLVTAMFPERYALLGLGIVGAAFAGVLLQRMLEILIQRRMPGPVTAALMLTLSLSPVFGYLAVTNLPVFLALAVFGHGVADAVRFVQWNNTQAGFRAGVLFLIAGFCSSSALLYVLTAAIVIPFLAHGRAGQRAARRANMQVLLFPLVYTGLLWMVLQLVFTRSLPVALTVLHPAVMAERAQTYIATLGTASGLLIVVPVVISIVCGIMLRSLRTVVGAAMVFIAVTIGYVVGVVTGAASGSTYLLTVVIAVTMLPRPTSRGAQAGVATVLLAQLPLSLVGALDRPAVVQWTDVLPF